MVDYGGAAAFMGLLFLLTHVAAPMGTAMGAVIALRTPPRQLRWRGVFVAGAWILTPWLGTLMSLALAGFDPFDALLHLEGLSGAIPMASLGAAVVVGLILAVRLRHNAEEDGRDDGSEET